MTCKLLHGRFFEVKVLYFTIQQNKNSPFQTVAYAFLMSLVPVELYNKSNYMPWKQLNYHIFCLPFTLVFEISSISPPVYYLSLACATNCQLNPFFELPSQIYIWYSLLQTFYFNLSKRKLGWWKPFIFLWVYGLLLPKILNPVEVLNLTCRFSKYSCRLLKSTWTCVLKSTDRLSSVRYWLFILTVYQVYCSTVRGIQYRIVVRTCIPVQVPDYEFRNKRTLHS